MRDEPRFDGAYTDAAMVMAKLGLGKVIIDSIGDSYISALSFAQAHPHSVGAGLLINLTPPRRHGIKGRSLGGAFREMSFANPIVSLALTKIARKAMRSDLVDNLLDKYFSTCEANRIALGIPEAQSLRRAITQAAMARTIEVFVRKREAFVRHWTPSVLSCGPWTNMVGLDNHKCDVTIARTAWPHLPGFAMGEVLNSG